MSAETVTVELGSRSYPVRIGAGMRREALAAAERRLAAGQKCVAITSPGVAAAQSGFAAELARLMPVLATAADGETAKSAAELARVWDFLAANGVARDGAVFALGGGVVGDLAGFAAASYLRGVALIQVPTTLLAMVDSSVGGKTGINLARGKNLAGAFHQPALVAADTDLLATLPPRELAAGMAEVLKYGLLGDASLLAEVEAAGRLSWDHPALPGIVRRCVRMKAEVVGSDERETAAEGGRKEGLEGLHPLVGAYNSWDPTVIEKHMQQMNRALIDALAVSWWYDTKANGPNQVLDMVFEKAVIHNLKIPMVDIIQYDPENRHQFADYWHTHADNLESVDPATLKAVGETLAAQIYTEDARWKTP